MKNHSSSTLHKCWNTTLSVTKTPLSTTMLLPFFFKQKNPPSYLLIMVCHCSCLAFCTFWLKIFKCSFIVSVRRHHSTQSYCHRPQTKHHVWVCCHGYQRSEVQYLEYDSTRHNLWSWWVSHTLCCLLVMPPMRARPDSILALFDLPHGNKPQDQTSLSQSAIYSLQFITERWHTHTQPTTVGLAIGVK